MFAVSPAKVTFTENARNEARLQGKKSFECVGRGMKAECAGPAVQRLFGRKLPAHVVREGWHVVLEFWLYVVKKATSFWTVSVSSSTHAARVSLLSAGLPAVST